MAGCWSRSRALRRRRSSTVSRCAPSATCRASPTFSQAAGAAMPHGRAGAAMPAETRPEGPDLADVRGQEGAKRALEIAAAGGHNLLMVGPPGAGKTMLARRLRPSCRRRRFEEALEITRRCTAPPGTRRRAACDPAALPGAAPHRLARRASSGGGSRRRPARSRSRTAACCSSTSCPSSLAANRRAAGAARGRARGIMRGQRTLDFPANAIVRRGVQPLPVRPSAGPLQLHDAGAGPLPAPPERPAASTGSTWSARSRRCPPRTWSASPASAGQPRATSASV